MAWLLAVGVALIVMIFYPRQLAVVAGIAVLFALGMFTYIQFQTARVDQERGLVSGRAEVDRVRCPEPQFPVAVIFANAGERALVQVSFELVVRDIGRSSPLHTQFERSDMIVPPGGEATSCWGADDYSIRNRDPASLDWSVETVSVTFD